MFGFVSPLSRSDAAVRGTLAAVVGIIALVWPGITIGVAVALFAIYCLVDAVSKGVTLFRSGESAGDRATLLLVAVVDVAAGLVAIVYPGITAQALVIVIGVWALVSGSAEIGAAWRLRGTHPGSGWLTVGGVLSLVAGVLLIAWPNIGAVTLALVFGIYLLAYGATLLVGAAITAKDHNVRDALA
jgi:uncharacterized membrane protein HdeD (DUF308 family)